MKNKKLIKVLFIGVIVVVAGIVFSCTIKNKNAKTLSEEKTTESSKNEDESSKEESLANLCVHVCGQVKSPGVYYLNNTARVFDAVKAAGGFLEEADTQYLNLAQLIKDGEQIYIPSKEEVASGKVAESSKAKFDDGLVNINLASLEDLKTLPGIGDVKAEAIVSYRENVGNFSNVEDIKNVAGIKDSSFEKIKDYIKV